MLISFAVLGVLLSTVAQMDHWIWSVAVRPNTNTIAMGCVDGTIACYNLIFSTVHCVDHARYAVRWEFGFEEWDVFYLPKYYLLFIRSFSVSSLPFILVFVMDVYSIVCNLFQMYKATRIVISIFIATYSQKFFVTDIPLFDFFSRKSMTDVYVQNLEYRTSSNIRCQDLVKKMSLYDTKLAIQLSDKIQIYKQSSGLNKQERRKYLKYTLQDTIRKDLEFSLMVRDIEGRMK